MRWIGASNYTGARLAEAMEASASGSINAFVCLQPHYNLMERKEFESDLLPVVEKYGLGVITYFSLAAGFLTGKYQRGMDVSNVPRGRTVAKYLNDRGFAIVDALVEVASALHSTPSAVALAWLLSRPGVTAPIASVTKVSQLDDLAAAARLQSTLPAFSGSTGSAPRPELWPGDTRACLLALPRAENLTPETCRCARIEPCTPSPAFACSWSGSAPWATFCTPCPRSRPCAGPIPHGRSAGSSILAGRRC